MLPTSFVWHPENMKYTTEVSENSQGILKPLKPWTFGELSLFQSLSDFPHPSSLSEI